MSGCRWLPWAALASGCSDARLRSELDTLEYVDNKIELSGEICASESEEVAFPVKLLIVMDQSASLQCTDPTNARLAALNALGEAMDDIPSVEFGVVGFASWSKIVEFSPDWADAAEALAPEDGQGGPATDYQGALSTVYTMLEQDMIDAGPAEAARSKYILLFLSDGIPEPRCRAGCDDGDTVPDSLYGVCNTTQELEEGDYVDMTYQCPEYNQETQIVQKVQDIQSLGDYYGVGALSLSTILLFAPDDAVKEACGSVDDFGYVREEAEPLLQSMASEGGGTYRDVNTSEDIDFVNVDYVSLEAPYTIKELFAVNLSAPPGDGVFLTDSDGDGRDDSAEFSAGTDRLSPDTDGDGFGDLIEHIYAASGADGLDSSLPSTGCLETDDRDGDGLLACEEALAGTDDTLPDTDGDRMPDGIELRLGLDPLQDDSETDYDFDGVSSADELRAGTHPRIFDEAGSALDPIRYTVESAPEHQGSACYHYRFQNISLTATLGATASDPDAGGYNRLLPVAEEEPAGLGGGRGNFKVACLQARYLSDRFKEPASGEIRDIHPAHFVDYPDFQPDSHCISLDTDASVMPEERLDEQDW